MKLTHQIVGGGIDLITAPEKVGQGRLTDVVNFEPDSVGVLHSRPGLEVIAQGLQRPTYIYRSGDNRYAVDSGSLRYGANLSAVVAVGLDSGPTKITSYAGYSWLMNRSAQLLLENHRAMSMGVRGPSVPPRVVLGGQLTSLVSDFDSLADRWEVWYASANTRRLPKLRRVYYSAGLVSGTSGLTTVTGIGTEWTGDFRNLYIDIYNPDGETIFLTAAIDEVTSATEIQLAMELTESFSGRRYEIYDWVDVFQFDTSNKLYGDASLRVDLNPPGTWSIEKEFRPPLDLGIPNDSGQSKAMPTDFLRLAFYVDRPTAIDQISISFTDSSKKTVTAVIDGSLLNQSMFSWNHLRVPRSLDEKAILGANPEYWRLAEARAAAIEAGDAAAAENLARQMNAIFSRAMALTPSFSSRMGIEELDKTASFNWNEVIAARISVVARESCTIHLDRCEFVGGEQAPLEGSYRYWVTFENDKGHESSPSPASEPIDVSNEPVTLIHVPVSTDPGVVRRRIYRSGGTLMRPVRVGTIWNNSDTTFVDRTPDAEARLMNIEPPWDTDPPPRGSGICGPFFGRLVAWGVAEHPARLYWSETAKPWSWPGSGDEFEGNWVDVGGDDDPIVEVVAQSNTLRIYKQRSIWRISGDPDKSDPEVVISGIGVAGPYAVAPGMGVDFFLGSDGVYRFDGDSIVRISNRIQPIFSGRHVSVHPQIPALPPLDPERLSAACMKYFGGTLMLGAATVGGEGVLLVWKEDKNEWFRMTLPGGLVPTALSYEMYGAAPSWLIGAPGFVYAPRYHLESDSGTRINVALQTALLSPRDSTTTAIWKEVEVDFSGRDVVVKGLFSDGMVLDFGTLSSDSRTVTRFAVSPPDGRESELIGLRLEGQIDRRFSIYAIYLHFIVEARKGKSFDSGPINLSDASALESIELDVTARTGLALHVFSDLPDGLVQQRVQVQIPPMPGRAVLRRDVSGVDGRVFRIKAVAHSGEFQIHSLRIRVRPYAMYLSDGEKWLLGPF